MTPTTIVVGGGIAGLVVAWELCRAGRQTEILEAGPDVGGCIAPHTLAGLRLDAGAESYATGTPVVGDLIRDLGLEASVVEPNPVGAWVRHGRGSARLPSASLLGIPSHPLAADVRAVLGPLGAARAALDLVLPAGVGADRDGSLGALVGRRMGRRAVDRLVEPVAGGVYSADPAELDVDVVAPRLRQALRDNGSLAKAVRTLRGGGARPGSAVAGLSGGLFTLVEALRAAIVGLGGTISTGTSVRSLRQSDGTWDLATSDGARTGRTVVLAVPGPPAVALLAGVDITAPADSAASSDVLLVSLVLDSAALDGHPCGTGVLVSSHARGVSAKALTHATAKWAWLAEQAGLGRHVLRLSYGRGDEAPPASAGSTTLALADASTLTGVHLSESALVDSDVVRWTSALTRPQPGHRAAMDALRGQVAERPGLALTGSMVAGTGLAAVVADARQVAARLVSAGRPAAGLPAGDRV